LAKNTHKRSGRTPIAGKHLNVLNVRMNSIHNKYSLRHAIDKKYLSASGEWTDDPSQALKFDTAADAIRHRKIASIEWAVVDPPNQAES